MQPETEGPHFAVVKGTNQRWCTGEVPRIFDTGEIAQTAIDNDRESRKMMKLQTNSDFVPISVAEHNRKYAKLMGIEED